MISDPHDPGSFVYSFGHYSMTGPPSVIEFHLIGNGIRNWSLGMILDKLGPLYDVLTKLLTLLTSVTDMSIKTYPSGYQYHDGYFRESL